MSVQINQYLAYGYMLPFNEANIAISDEEDKRESILDKYDDSAFNLNITEVNNCSLIYDGMNGEYIFFGKIFKKSDNGEPLDTIQIPKVSSKIKKNIDNELQKIFGSNFNTKPSLFLISHYR